MAKGIYFAAGCFWGAQKYLKLIRGVVATEVGYANGNTENPTYKEVYTDRTGFAEAVHVQYDPAATATYPTPSSNWQSRQIDIQYPEYITADDIALHNLIHRYRGYTTYSVNDLPFFVCF